MTWAESLLAPARMPKGLKGPGATPPTRRFDVYRNNVMSSLVNALRDGFPVIHRLVGEAFFAGLATEYVREHPPTSPCVVRYGDSFSDFIAGFPPAASVPYLADMARLEYALRQAYHAADVMPVEASEFERPDLAEAKLHLAPAVSVVQSSWPIYDIWRANLDRSKPARLAGAQSVLITRPDWDPVAEPVSAEEAGFVTRLATEPLAIAARDLPDLAPILTRLMLRKSIAAVEALS